MRISPRAGLAAGLVAVGLLGGLVYGFAGRPEARTRAAGDDEAKPSADEAGVHKALEGFVGAFNENDAKKLAATLTSTAEYVDEDGNRVEGPAAVADAATASKQIGWTRRRSPGAGSPAPTDR